MITYHLSFIPFIRHAALIYMNYHFMPDEVNIYMIRMSREFHDEAYSNVEPSRNGMKYYMAKIIVSRVGKALFENYAMFLYCNIAGNTEDYNNYYQLLPPSYKRKIDP